MKKDLIAAYRRGQMSLIIIGEVLCVCHFYVLHGNRWFIYLVYWISMFLLGRAAFLNDTAQTDAQRDAE